MARYDLLVKSREGVKYLELVHKGVTAPTPSPLVLRTWPHSEFLSKQEKRTTALLKQDEKGTERVKNDVFIPGWSHSNKIVFVLIQPVFASSVTSLA